nr:hypothetical protein [Asticcacaulis sp. AND118]
MTQPLEQAVAVFVLFVDALFGDPGQRRLERFARQITRRFPQGVAQSRVRDTRRIGDIRGFETHQRHAVDDDRRLAVGAHLACQPIGRVVMQSACRDIPVLRWLALAAVVGFVADRDGHQLVAQFVAEALPRRLQSFEHLVEVEVFRAPGSGRDLLQHGARRHGHHRTIDSVVAMVEPVFRRVGVHVVDVVMVGQQTVQSPDPAQQGGHAPRSNVNAGAFIGCIQAGQVFPRNPRQVLRIGQLPRDEAAVLVKAFAGVRPETPLLGLVQAGDLVGNNVPALFVVAPFLIRRLVALGEIAMTVRHDLVGGAVVEGLRIGDDMVDVGFV